MARYLRLALNPIFFGLFPLEHGQKESELIAPNWIFERTCTRTVTSLSRKVAHVSLDIFKGSLLVLSACLKVGKLSLGFAEICLLFIVAKRFLFMNVY